MCPSSKHFTNQEVAQVFQTIASLLEIKGEVIYKTLAYRRVAESLNAMAEDVNTLQSEGRLEEIPGVGKAISEKIAELLTTGKLGFLERLEQEVPLSLVELLQIPDVGPKKAALFWKQAGITTLAGLEMAAQAGYLRGLSGMGEKSETRILEGVRAYHRRLRRFPLAIARSMARPWITWLKAQPGVVQVEPAGSMRRWKPFVGDVDLVFAAQNPVPVMEAFVKQAGIERVLAQGEYKTSVELKDGLRLQIWCQPPERFGSLLQFVTGSKEHNVRLRELAQKRGFSLSERGLLELPGGKEHLCASEQEVYNGLGLPWIAPELREDRGEVQAAIEGQLPALVEFKDIRGDLHIHTTWSDGEGSIDEMVLVEQQLGRSVLAITDHSFLLGRGEFTVMDKLRSQRAEIEALQKQLGNGFTVLHGAEVDILPDGSLDQPDEILAWLDVVVISLHTDLHQPREVMTERLIKGMRNPHVDIVAHPSGRSMPDFDGADLDWDAVFNTARECNLALEINANPAHMDLDEVHARKAADEGVLLTINTDSHAPRQLGREYGVGVARRAWLGPEKILTAWPVEKILTWLRNHKDRKE